MKLVICHNILRNVNFLVKCFILDKVKQETITQFLLYLTERVNYSNTNMENVIEILHFIEFMGLVTYKRSIGSRHPYKPVPAGPGLHCLGWPVSVAHDMSRSLPATSCTGGVRRRSRYLALTFFPCTRCAFL